VNDLLPLERADTLSIADLYDEVAAALAQRFPRNRPLWVRGEVQSISDRTGHCYIDLVDPEGERGRSAPVLKVKCWQTTWGPLRAALFAEGITLEPGMVVILRGTLDFYKPRAEVGFILAELDVTALLGRLAAQRAALLRALDAEGILEANRRLPVPVVPLRVGLVASPGTEGEQDFLGQLAGSGFAFLIRRVPATVQGADAPASIARALTTLAETACDLIVVVRGGGSKGDLAAFDSEPVARTIATMGVPVWTGIGHTGDQSVADLVANRSFITPTECGQEVVRQVGLYVEALSFNAETLVRRSVQVLDEAQEADTRARQRLTAAARNQLARHGDRLVARAARLARDAPGQLTAATNTLERAAARITPLVRGQVTRAEDQLDAWRRLLLAYNVERQLERGYTLTLSGSRIVRRAADLVAGEEIVTRFADGSARSVVQSVETASETRWVSAGTTPRREDRP
jgi:exodeoxyribonuclease VII large subunit